MVHTTADCYIRVNYVLRCLFLAVRRTTLLPHPNVLYRSLRRVINRRYLWTHHGQQGMCINSSPFVYDVYWRCFVVVNNGSIVLAVKAVLMDIETVS